MASTTQTGPPFFPSSALDHAFAGIGAGTVAVLCMQPLDLLKVQFQVARTKPVGGLGRAIYSSLRDIYVQRGVRGLYRGVGANIAGNASSWGLYFLFYTMLKQRAQSREKDGRLSSAGFLLASAEASAVTAIMTNPIWVVKVRMFTTNPETPSAYRGLWHGLSSVYRNEGIAGLYRGTLLALVGVSNGAIQFMAYEQMKRFALEAKRKRYERAGNEWNVSADRLSNTMYTMMSGASKVAALSATYPYQVVRSRIQSSVTAPMYPNIRVADARTFREEGVRGFYRGLATNLVRVLPGTCVTFVVYENIAWLLRSAAYKREKAKEATSNQN